MLLTWLIAAGLYLGGLFLLSWIWRQQFRALHPTQEARPISVVVALHNEDHNLPRLLAALERQIYPQAEFLLVLDRCSDDSLSIIQQWQKRWPALRYLEIIATPPDWSPKKWAVQQGVEQATHELIALTDADCWMGPQWLSEVNRHFTDGTDLVLGISPYEQRPGWLNRFIQFETWYTALQYVGGAILRKPYMAVGRNLAYRKSWFLQHGGLQAFAHFLSGDDDLLVNAYAKRDRTTLMLSEASWTFSAPKESWRDWWHQKTRHISGSAGYDWQSKAWLSLFHLSHFWFYLGFFLLLSVGYQPSLVLSVFSIRVILGALLYRKWLPKQVNPNLAPWYPVLDFLFFLYNLTVVPLGLIKPPSWQKHHPEAQKTPKKTARW